MESVIYNNTISDIESSVLEPWRMCGEYKDGFTVTVGGSNEESCMNLLVELELKHGELTWYSGYSDEDYASGEYIGRENFKYD